MLDRNFDAARIRVRGRTGVIAATAAGVVLTALAVAGVTTQVEAQDPKPAARKAKAAPAAENAPQAAPAAASAAPGTATASTVPKVESTTYDQWTVVCQGQAEAAPKRTCSAVLKVVDPNRKQVVFAWVLARTPEGRIAAVMQAPTGVQVQRGITLKLGDAGPPHVMPFTSCEPQNCEVSQVLDDGTLRELEAAPQATATIYAKDGRGIQFNMPLKGIDKALAAVRA